MKPKLPFTFRHLSGDEVTVYAYKKEEAEKKLSLLVSNYFDWVLKA